MNHGRFRAGVGGACCLTRRGVEIDLRSQRFLSDRDDDNIVLLVRPISLVEILDGIVTEGDRLHPDLKRGVVAIFDHRNQCVQHYNEVLLYVYILIFDIDSVRGRAPPKMTGRLGWSRGEKLRWSEHQIPGGAVGRMSAPFSIASEIDQGVVLLW